MKKTSLTYKSSGVNYDVMDPLKRLGQIEGKKTAMNLFGTEYKELHESRGESAYVLEEADQYVAVVQEGLGTKSLVADAMLGVKGKTYYEEIAQDTVACIINDLITVGAAPVALVAYWAVGSQQWFANKERMENLVTGWRRACDLSGAVWGGGETPTLSGIINPDTIDLAGAGFGIIKPKERLTLGEKLQAGDAIIVFESSGIHANGLSLARKLASTLPQKYETRISDGRMYGEALLDPTIIYAKLIQDLFTNKIDIHYMANITGHGWRKLMRNKKELTYRITNIPPVPNVLQFIQKEAHMDDKEAYATFNMGAGFAIFIPQDHVQGVLEISSKHKIKAYHAGVVEDGEKQVIIEQKNIVFKGESLQVRA